VSEKNWFKEQQERFPDLVSWHEYAEVLAKEFVPEADRDVIINVTTFEQSTKGYETHIVNARGPYGDYVSTDDFRALAEKFLLACCLIQEHEKHEADLSEQNEKLFWELNELIKTQKKLIEETKAALRV
jgi:hypothetical protein